MSQLLLGEKILNEVTFQNVHVFDVPVLGKAKVYHDLA
jgi:hypothetical protein